MENMRLKLGIRRAQEFARLCRLVNCFAISLQFVGVRVFLHLPITQQTTGRALTWLLIAACAYIYNDIVDVFVDSINRPNRPLQRGLIDVQFARKALAFMMVVVLISLPLFWGRQMVYPLVGIASSWLYSTIVRKHDALLANLLTASTIILVLISADAGQQLNSVAVVFDAVVFAVMLARELQKDMMDIRGDAGFRSPAVLSRCDVHRSALLYRSLLGLALSGFFLIAWLERYDMSHSFPVCIVAAAPLGAALVFNFRAPYQPQQQVALAKLCLYATTALLFWGNGHAVS